MSFTLAGAERRSGARGLTTYQVTVFDDTGAVLARGKTSNTSPTGALVVARMDDGPPQTDTVVLEVTVPRDDTPGAKSPATTARIAARIARSICLGRFVGMGMEFIKELPHP